MLRLIELKLPIDHPPEALHAAAAERLGVAESGIVSLAISRRAHDARRKSAILMVYTVDVEVENEAAVLRQLPPDAKVRPTPDTTYRPVATASGSEPLRPVVIGAGPCGLFAALILAEAGFRPLILERGKVVRERTQDTWGLWRRHKLNPEFNMAKAARAPSPTASSTARSRIPDI